MNIKIWDDNLTYFLWKWSERYDIIIVISRIPYSKMIEIEQDSISDESEMIIKETSMRKNLNLICLWKNRPWERIVKIKIKSYLWENCHHDMIWIIIVVDESIQLRYYCNVIIIPSLKFKLWCWVLCNAEIFEIERHWNTLSLIWNIEIDMLK